MYNKIVFRSLLISILSITVIVALFCFNLWQSGAYHVSAQTAVSNADLFDNMQPLANMDMTAVFSNNPNDVWVAGRYQDYYQNCNTTPTPATTKNATIAGALKPSYPPGPCSTPPKSYQIYFQHYNGKQWKVVAQQYLKQDGIIEAFSAISEHEIYAVGSHRSTSDSTDDEAILEKWDGTKWTFLSPPKPANSVCTKLHAILAISNSNIWAVGEYRPNGSNTTYPLIYQWNGSTWRLMDSPSYTIGNLTSLQRMGKTTNVLATGMGYDGTQRVIKLTYN